MTTAAASSAGAVTPGAGPALDVRGLEQPDDILAILKKASELPPGSTFSILSTSNPFQLYDLLQQRGYFLQMQREAGGFYTGTVKPREVEKLRH